MTPMMAVNVSACFSQKIQLIFNFVEGIYQLKSPFTIDLIAPILVLHHVLDKLWSGTLIVSFSIFQPVGLEVSKLYNFWTFPK